MKAKDRLVSLDLFRGITIFGMILVNNPGSWGAVFPPLKHAAWHGCTPTDLVFPFFLFIVGVSISFSMRSSVGKPAEHGVRLKKALWRALRLFAIGFFLVSFPFMAKEDIRIPGVLQRIALVFAICVPLFLKLDWRKLLGLSIGLLLIYWGLLVYVPVPGIGTPDLSDANLTLPGWIDKQLLYPFTYKQYWDPEGLLSTLGALVTCLAGILSGLWLQNDLTPQKKLRGMLRASVGLLLIGLLWDRVLPLNKPLWTSSYAVYTAGWALLGLVLCYWFFDVQKKRWAVMHPFLAYGRNPLALYVGSEFIAKLTYMIKPGGISLKARAYQALLDTGVQAEVASLIYALLVVGFFALIAEILYRRRVIIKV